MASVGAIGFSATITQLVLMRELLCVLAGNELILGVILGNWFLLTGLGAALGRTAGTLRRPLGVLTAAQVLVALLPAASVVALRMLRDSLFIRGSEIGPAGSAVASLALLGPYCVVSGYVLTLACGIAGGGNAACGRQDLGRADGVRRAASGAWGVQAIGRVYAWDVLGGIAGGLAFTFLLVHVMSDLAALYVPAAANLALAAALSLRLRRWAWAAAAGVVAAGAAVAVAAVDWGALSTRAAFSGQEVVYDSAGPYGRVVVTRGGEQHTFFHSGVPLFTTNDTERIEETVHLAMAQRPAASSALILCGGVSGTAAEAMKYPAMGKVVAAEINPRVIEAARRFVPGNLADGRIRLEPTDGRRLLRRGGELFDVILSDAPDPSTSQINRFFTAEFAAEAKARLRAGGVLAVSLGSYANFISPETGAMLATMQRTLKTAFANVLILPAGRVVLLASDGPLTAEVAPAMRQAGVETRWVTPQYAFSTLTPERLADLRAAGGAGGAVNRDFTPSLYFLHLRQWLSRHGARVTVGEAAVLVAVVLGVVVLLVRGGRVGTVVFTTGFAASALEVVVLLGYQIAHGSLYEGLGLIVTAFMAGLAAGVVLANRRPAQRPRRALALVTAAVAGFAVALPAGVWALTRPVGPAAAALSAYGAFPLLTGVLGALVGAAFPLAVAASATSGAATTATAGRIYAADYVGGCVGAVLVSTLLIPLLGVPAACGIIAAVNAGAAALLLRR